MPPRKSGDSPLSLVNTRAGAAEQPTAAGAPVYRQRFSVSYEYPVYFTDDVFGVDNLILEEALCELEPSREQRVVFFIDANVAAASRMLKERITGYVNARPGRLKLVCTPEVLAGGEHVKNDPALVERLQRRLCDLGMDRHAWVVCVGGGALLDLVGYAAATTHRGVRHIRIPTTVLAQCDSGVGVKNAVNAFGKKNFLGCFAPPHAVINDASFLETLPQRDRICGLAEAVKVALIRDAVFFNWLESSADALHRGEPRAMGQAIRRCAELHMRQIAHGGDPFERGSGRPLDFGHWSAHRLEALTHNDVRHGEAVATGVALDTRYSVQVGMLEPGADKRVHQLLSRLGLCLWHPALLSRDDNGRYALLDGLEEFREHLGGELTVTMLRGIGRGEEINVVDHQQVLAAIKWLQQQEGGR